MDILFSVFSFDDPQAVIEHTNADTSIRDTIFFFIIFIFLLKIFSINIAILSWFMIFVYVNDTWVSAVLSTEPWFLLFPYK